MGRRGGFWLAAAATAGLALALTRLGEPLQTPEAPRRIVSLELAPNVAKVERILESWKSVVTDEGSGFELARRSIYIDFPFIVAYTTVLTGACWWAAGVLRRRGLPGARVVRTVGWLQPVAGALDVVENVGMLVEIGRHQATELPALVPPVVAASAATKFVLVGLGVMAIVWGVGARWVLRMGRRRVAAGGS